MVINATSASRGGELPRLPHDCLNPGAVCYDLVYSDRPTVFMHWAEQEGAAVVLDGWGMLVEQAAESFYLWRRRASADRDSARHPSTLAARGQVQLHHRHRSRGTHRERLGLVQPA